MTDNRISDHIAELEAEVERLRRAGYEVGYHDAMKALGRGECEWTPKEKWLNSTGDDHVYGYETSCGVRHTWWPDSMPNFCPTCGGRVKVVIE